MKPQYKLMNELCRVLDGKPTSPTELLELCKTNPDLESAFLGCTVASRTLSPAFIGAILKKCRDIKGYSITSAYDYLTGKQLHTISKEDASFTETPSGPNPIPDIQSEREYWLYRDGETYGTTAERTRIADILKSDEAAAVGIQNAITLCLRSDLSVEESLKFMADMSNQLTLKRSTK